MALRGIPKKTDFVAHAAIIPARSTSSLQEKTGTTKDTRDQEGVHCTGSFVILRDLRGRDLGSRDASTARVRIQSLPGIFPHA